MIFRIYNLLGVSGMQDTTDLVDQIIEIGPITLAYNMLHNKK